MRYQQVATRRRALALVVAMPFAAWIMGASASAAPAPIKVGTLVTEGSSLGFPSSASRTLKAFFQDYNAKGGLNGRKLQLTVANDLLAPDKNIALSKRLIDEGAVAFVGSMAIFNCLGNAAVLQKANVYTIGFGQQAACFRLKQFGSINPSLSTQVALSVQYAKEHITSKVCLLAVNLPGAQVLWKRAEQILAKLGTKLTYKNTGVAGNAEPTPALLDARRAGCRATVAMLSPAQEIQVVNARKTQQIENMELVLANSHDYKFLKGTGGNAEGSYVFSQLYPFSQNDGRSRGYRRFTNRHKISPDTFGEQAYVSAELFVNALESIKGAVTRKSVSAAIARLDARSSLLPGKRFIYGGRGTGNAPNVGGYMMRVKGGKFTFAPKAEILLPRRARSLGGA